MEAAAYPTILVAAATSILPLLMQKNSTRITTTPSILMKICRVAITNTWWSILRKHLGTSKTLPPLMPRGASTILSFRCLIVMETVWSKPSLDPFSLTRDPDHVATWCARRCKTLTGTWQKLSNKLSRWVWIVPLNNRTTPLLLLYQILLGHRKYVPFPATNHHPTLCLNERNNEKKLGKGSYHKMKKKNKNHITMHSPHPHYFKTPPAWRKYHTLETFLPSSTWPFFVIHFKRLFISLYSILWLPITGVSRFAQKEPVSL